MGVSVYSYAERTRASTVSTWHETCRAVVFTGDGRHEVREFPIPEPPDGGAVLRVEAVGLCGSDVAQHAGVELIPGSSAFPVVPGHETVGRVWRLGRGAALGVSEGDRVAVDEVLSQTAAACGLRLHDAGRRRRRRRPVRRVRRVHGRAARHAIAPPARRRARGRAHRVRTAWRTRSTGSRSRACAPDRPSSIEGPGHQGLAVLQAVLAAGADTGDRHRYGRRRAPARRRAGDRRARGDRRERRPTRSRASATSPADGWPTS